jgi:hypothetical protein
VVWRRWLPAFERPVKDQLEPANGERYLEAVEPESAP